MITKFNVDTQKEEIDVLSQLNHENIVRYFDHFPLKIGGDIHMAIITAYCEVSLLVVHIVRNYEITLYYYLKKNGDLDAKIKDFKKSEKYFEESQILTWMCQATNAISYLHSKKPTPIIHRDIKPA